MEIKHGNKQTEIGVIPEDWLIEQLSSLCSITTGKKNTQDRIIDGQFPFFVRSQEVERIDSYSYDGESILTAGDGVGTGKVYHYINGKFDFHQRVYKLSDFPDHICGYYLYLYFKNHFLNRIQQFTAKTSVDSVRLEMISNMPIPVPPISEQMSISIVMKDIDSLISCLEKLIEKKKLIKQGVMQELLTGKSRLPGFDSEWETLELGHVCQLIVDGTHYTPKYCNSGIPFYSVENVSSNDFTNTKYISVLEHTELIKRCKIKKGDILISRIGSLGDSKLIDWDVEASIYVSLAMLRVNEQIDNRFLYCYTKSRKFIEDLENRSLMNASPKKINMGEIASIPISVPSIKEQLAIAQILTDLASEICTLEHRLNKTKQIKQGMMQELLTGRIRLV